MKIFLTFIILIVAVNCKENTNPILNSHPIQILENGLSHGIGESVLDSPLLKDSVNASILIASRKGTTFKKLYSQFANLSDFQNRINLLQKADLLTGNPDHLNTSFPILINDDSKQYFKRIRQSVDNIYPVLRPILSKVLDKIKGKGWQKWSYHTIWSLIFDSQFIWYEMVERNLVPSLTPPIAWVIYPQAIYKTGTNYYPDTELKDFWVVVSWSPNGSNTLGVLGGNWEILYNCALDQSSSLSNQNIEFLIQSGLLNDKHEVTFPVIFPEDEIYQDLKNTANIYLDLLVEDIPINDFNQIIGRDKKFSFAVVYHDICWEIMKRLVEDGSIEQPLCLTAEMSNKTKDYTGACSIIGVYQPFVNQIINALEK